MMDGWRRASNENPCPICGKTDNCEVSEDGVFAYCGRIEEGSIKQNAGGQFLHRLKDDEEIRDRPRTTVARPKKEKRTASNPDLQTLAQVYFNMPDAEARRKELAKMLGVSADSLRLLRVGFDGRAWTIPQFNFASKVIGIQRRFHSGFKCSVSGSSAGLTFSKLWQLGSEPIFLPEGMSDTAALLTMTINTVGRPSDLSGVDRLIEMLRSIPTDRPLIVLADNDRKPLEKLHPTHRPDCACCKQCWPGRNGAIVTATKLSTALNRPIQWAFPPDGAKDAREWLQWATESYRQRMLIDSKAASADAPDSVVMLSVLRRDFLNGLKLDSINSAVVAEPQAVGPAVSLDEWREQLRTRRVESVGHPGVFLDRSPTGCGKTFADFAAIQEIADRGGKVLVVVPTHKNCNELEAEFLEQRIDAVAYPARLTSGDELNCWNSAADDAETMGLSAVAAVCPTCRERKRCSQSGYLKELKRASEATVAIATHSRASYAGLASLSAGREYVSIHEDALNVLRPSCSVNENGLRIARDEVLNRLVNDPKWLNWYGEILRRDDNGRELFDHQVHQRRDALHEFARLLFQTCDWLLKELADHGRTRRLTTPQTIPKPVGVERLLFRATGEARKVGHQFSGSVWRLLLAVATGEIADLGVIVDGSAKKLAA